MNRLAALIRTPLLVAALLLAPVLASTASAQIGRPPEKPKPPPEAAYETKPRPGEVRATWLRFGDSDYVSTPARTADTMKRLRDMGFNAVYLSIWQEGFPLFPSATFQKTGGGPDRLPALGSRDLLSEALIEAHRNGILLIVNLEGGLIATRRDQEAPLVKANPEWILRDAKAAFSGPLNSSWLNPAHPDVRKFFTDMIGEVIENYDIDGVLFDERMCWPGPDLGHDDFTKAAFAKEGGGETAVPAKAGAKDAAFNRWRAIKASAMVRELSNAVKQKRQGLILSFAAPPAQVAADSWMCQWPSWTRGGMFDEIIIKTTAPGPSEFKTVWDDVMKSIRERRPATTVSIRALGDGPDLSWPDLRKQIEMVRASKAGGFALSPARSPLFTHQGGVTEFLDAGKGRLRHPLRGLDWRPGPLKPERVNYRGEYVVIRGLPSGFYRVITGGKEPGAWVESKLKLAEGAAQISKEAAASLQAGGVVEFLVDRRAENLQAIPDPSAPPPEPKPEAAPSKREKPAAPGGEKPKDAPKPAGGG